jgi:flavin reductase (DIM6/NTAB) family NADH-FMN oxidoreductase RutF
VGVATEEFDAFVAGLDYPMFVVTTVSAGERAGCLVGFTTQASINPPRMLVCLSVANHTYRVARDAELLAVHVLDPTERELAELFGGRTGDRIDKFEHCRWHAGTGGLPLLEDCPRRLVGRVLSRQQLGDHVGLLLDPLSVEGVGPTPALDFHQVEDIDAGHPA